MDSRRAVLEGCEDPTHDNYAQNRIMLTIDDLGRAVREAEAGPSFANLPQCADADEAVSVVVVNAIDGATGSTRRSSDHEDEWDDWDDE